MSPGSWPMRSFHLSCRSPTLPTPSAVSYGFQRCMLSLRNWVQSAGEDVAAALELETSSDVCARADVLAVASVSHSGVIASIEPAILDEKEMVRLLLAIFISDFMTQP